MQCRLSVLTVAGCAVLAWALVYTTHHNYFHTEVQNDSLDDARYAGTGSLCQLWMPSSSRSDATYVADQPARRSAVLGEARGWLGAWNQCDSINARMWPSFTHAHTHAHRMPSFTHAHSHGRQPYSQAQRSGPVADRGHTGRMPSITQGHTRANARGILGVVPGHILGSVLSFTYPWLVSRRCLIRRPNLRGSVRTRFALHCNGEVY